MSVLCDNEIGDVMLRMVYSGILRLESDISMKDVEEFLIRYLFND